MHIVEFKIKYFDTNSILDWELYYEGFNTIKDIKRFLNDLRNDNDVIMCHVSDIVFIVNITETDLHPHDTCSNKHTKKIFNDYIDALMDGCGQ